LSSLLLHTCCGPCTTYVNKWLSENGFAVKGFFYNPNIRPQEEYERRRKSMEQYSTLVGLEVFYEPNEVVVPLEDCATCYKVRLEKTAQKAKELNYDLFTTTLLISPYQDQVLLKKIGDEIGMRIGVEFLWQDFKKGFSESQLISKELGFYRQNYCGCMPREKNVKTKQLNAKK